MFHPSDPFLSELPEIEADEAVSTDFADDIDVEPTHAVFDRYGYGVYDTPLDTLFANQAMGFDMAGAMQ